MTGDKVVTVTLGGVVLYSGIDTIEIAKARAAVAAEYRAERDAANMRRSRRLASRRARR